jgi:activator of 2-hydroxyglutaryl-CoA dehydratase
LNGLEVRVTEVAEGVNREDIVAGLHSAIAKRTMSMVNRLGLVPPVVMAGGVAKNKGVVKAIEEEINAALIVPSEPQIVGALGATLLAMEDLAATTRQTQVTALQHGEKEPAPQAGEEDHRHRLH